MHALRPPAPIRVFIGEMTALEDLIQSHAWTTRKRARGDAIVLKDLAKVYSDGTAAVRGISIRVGAGEIYGMLGPNGAGKSTTLGILGTLIRPTGGAARLAGFDVFSDGRAVRRRVGFAMQQTGLDELATALELLVLQGRLHGLTKQTALDRARLLLRVVGLEDVAGKRLAGLSGGMQRRVDLASALMHLPSIVLFDEPTEGLDPRSRQAIWDVVDELRNRLGVTFILTTHYMDEAERLCDRIGIIDHGTLVAEGRPAELKQSVGRSLGIADPNLEQVYLHHTGHSLAAAEAPALGRAA